MSFIHGKWSHIFAVNGASIPLRFVFDSEQNALTHLEVQRNEKWVKASSEERADVEDSLKNANYEALEHPNAFGLESSGSLPAWANPTSAPDTIKVRLVLELEVDLNGAPLETIKENLHAIAEKAYSEGSLTGSSSAEIVNHSAKTFVVLALSEDEVAAHLLGRIESGDLSLEDIPNRMARYGLMEAPDFIDEMQERMAQ